MEGVLHSCRWKYEEWGLNIAPRDEHHMRGHWICHSGREDVAQVASVHENAINELSFSFQILGDVMILLDNWPQFELTSCVCLLTLCPCCVVEWVQLVLLWVMLQPTTILGYLSTYQFLKGISISILVKYSSYACGQLSFYWTMEIMLLVLCRSFLFLKNCVTFYFTLLLTWMWWSSWILMKILC